MRRDPHPARATSGEACESRGSLPTGVVAIGFRTVNRALLLVAVFAAGCGGGGGRDKPVTLALDFTPNAVHAPIYAAVRKGYDRDHGIRLRIRQPGSAPDALKLIAAGKGDVGVPDIHDLGLARERGS